MAENSTLYLAALAGLLALLTVLLAFLAWRAALRAPQKLRLLLEQNLAGARAEAETTRATLAAAEGRLTAAIQAGTTEALSKAFTQISAATQNVADTVDKLRRQAAEDQQRITAMIELRLNTIQTMVNEKLHEAVEKQMNASFSRVIEQFAQVQQAMGDVQNATKQIGDLKRVFANIKTRGGWGEAQLGAMLEEILPPGAFVANFQVVEGSRERVDFAIRMPSREALWLPVDAKFPIEDYERLLAAAEAADTVAEREAREGIARQIRLEAKKIHDKYIAPPVTVEYGVMYLPSDGLFAEVARSASLIEEMRRDYKIMILGPTTLPTMLQTVHLGYIRLDLEARASEIGKLLGATRQEMIRMDGVLDKLANNASTMSKNIKSARTRTNVMLGHLRTVELPGAAAAQNLLGLDAEEDQAEE